MWRLSIYDERNIMTKVPIIEKEPSGLSKITSNEHKEKKAKEKVKLNLNAFLKE